MDKSNTCLFKMDDTANIPIMRRRMRYLNAVFPSFYEVTQKAIFAFGAREQLVNGVKGINMWGKDDIDEVLMMAFPEIDTEHLRVRSHELCFSLIFSALTGKVFNEEQFINVVLRPNGEPMICDSEKLKGMMLFPWAWSSPFKKAAIELMPMDAADLCPETPKNLEKAHNQGPQVKRVNKKRKCPRDMESLNDLENQFWRALA